MGTYRNTSLKFWYNYETMEVIMSSNSTATPFLNITNMILASAHKGLSFERTGQTITATTPIAGYAMRNLKPDVPDIPAVNNGSLALQINGTTQTNFIANQSGNSTFNVNMPPIRRYMGETIATFLSKVGNVYKFSVSNLNFNGGDYRAVRFTHTDWTNVNDNVFVGMFLTLGSSWWSSAATPYIVF